MKWNACWSNSQSGRVSLLLTTALMLRVLRIRIAAAQHAVWAGVLIAMLALPLWIAWGPKATLPVLPAPSEPAVVMRAAPVSLVDPATPLEISEAPATKPPVWSWDAVWIGVYLLGAGALLLRLAIGTIRASRLDSASCVAPVTVGLLRPRIILPDRCREWPVVQLDAVLTHERAHARRRDPLFQWLALLNRAVFWFHPLAWWLERRLSALAEEACDSAVLERGHDPREYSECLLDLARAVQRRGHARQRGRGGDAGQLPAAAGEEDHRRHPRAACFADTHGVHGRRVRGSGGSVCCGNPGTRPAQLSANVAAASTAATSGGLGAGAHGDFDVSPGQNQCNPPRQRRSRSRSCR